MATSKKKTNSKSKRTYTSKSKSKSKKSVASSAPADNIKNVIDLKPKDKEAFGAVQARYNRLRGALADLAIRNADYEETARKESEELIKAIKSVYEEMMSQGREFALSYGIDVSGKEKWNLDMEQGKFFRSE